MPKSKPESPPASLDWMDVEARPAAVEEWRAKRLETLQRSSSWVGAVIVGGLIGFIAVLTVPGAYSWPLPEYGALFLGTGVPVGVVEFYFNRWMLARGERLRTLDVKRVALQGHTLYVELSSGRMIQRPLRQVYITRKPVAGGWHVVTLAAGARAPTFFVPPPVGTSLLGNKG